ncbi:MAG: hypothetical protein AB7G93_23190 [Bdellovibrionales bacterium]
MTHIYLFCCRFLTALLTLAGLSAESTFAVDVAVVEQELQTTGALGFVHGAVEQRELYVFTRVRARGIFNEADANQANPQILLADPSDIEILDDMGGIRPGQQKPVPLFP